MTRHPFRVAAMVAAGVLVVAGIVVLGLWLWLGAYAPLEALDSGYAPGPGVGAAVQPMTGSDGRPVFFPARRKSFDIAFTLRNHGRFAVTVTGLRTTAPGQPPSIGATQLLASSSGNASATPKDLVPFQNIRLSPGDSAIVVVHFALRCAGATSASADVFADRVRLRYRYLSLFTRTQTVRLPFAVTLRCVGGPPATP